MEPTAFLPKVMIGIPLFRPMLTKNCAEGMFKQIVSYPGPIEIQWGEGLTIEWARNEIVKAFLKTDCEYLFFVDSDTGVPMGGLAELVGHEKDIISGLYFGRFAPFNPVMKRKQPETLTYEPIHDYPEGLIECDLVGGGCLLVHRRVFETLKEPWYFCPRVDFSEDAYFCMKAQEAGFRIYADTIVKCLHDTEMTVSEDLYKGNRG